MEVIALLIGFGLGAFYGRVVAPRPQRISQHDMMEALIKGPRPVHFFDAAETVMLEVLLEQGQVERLALPRSKPRKKDGATTYQVWQLTEVGRLTLLSDASQRQLPQL